MRCWLRVLGGLAETEDEQRGMHRSSAKPIRLKAKAPITPDGFIEYGAAPRQAGGPARLWAGRPAVAHLLS